MNMMLTCMLDLLTKCNWAFYHCTEVCVGIKLANSAKGSSVMGDTTVSVCCMLMWALLNYKYIGPLDLT